MNILKLLSEEVFEVKDTMTAAKTKTLKERLNEVRTAVHTPNIHAQDTRKIHSGGALTAHTRMRGLPPGPSPPP